ncbi:NELL2-interacting cell ontogeny regulator 1 isoform X2 [Homo sapiens]|uniref:NELL2-interacting cell ontogeny regulator 1 isoform X2 n=1 Tax=Homo sapiens TaxID=9606 RepID=UPI0005D003A3|nr:neuropeptide-like protein C4orf48 isoform X2 [Homo sapiens]XP_047300254.1 neuropeptide-like protein C4orf48 isoform X2 [Homo sapiens]|eukprot:XP_011511773.1 neuropeptide-like protein C4orf48 isoform X2 [Homo sapiens]
MFRAALEDSVEKKSSLKETETTSKGTSKYDRERETEMKTVMGMKMHFWVRTPASGRGRGGSDHARSSFSPAGLALWRSRPGAASSRQSSRLHPPWAWTLLPGAAPGQGQAHPIPGAS